MMRRDAASQLTERDRQILYSTGRTGIASRSQLARHFWPGKQEATANKRLAQLVKAGYLESTFSAARGPREPIYSLTRKGCLLFDPSTRAKLQIGLPAQAARKQQLMAQEAYLWLVAAAQSAGGRLVGWHTEHELHAAWYLKHVKLRRNLLLEEEVADAQAVIMTPDGACQEIDIEIDGQYFGASLRGKGARLGQQGRPTLWICSAPRADYLRGVLHDYPNIQVVVL
jgi:DNA-binding MarR family transcriptional regulator